MINLEAGNFNQLFTLYGMNYLHPTRYGFLTDKEMLQICQHP